MQATRQAPTRQRGLIRRFRRRDDQLDIDDLTPSPAAGGRADVIDIRPVCEADIDTLSLRLEKLDAGVRLIVETMKSTYGDLSSSIDTLARQLDVADARTMVERIVAEEVGPLTNSIRELADSVQRVPHLLAAAMDDMGLRIDTGRWKLERTLAEGLDALRQTAPTSPGLGTGGANPHDPAPLAPRPFELESVELQFGGTPQGG
jgi:HAMP domain-containing protein